MEMSITTIKTNQDDHHVWGMTAADNFVFPSSAMQLKLGLSGNFGLMSICLRSYRSNKGFFSAPLLSELCILNIEIAKGHCLWQMTAMARNGTFMRKTATQCHVLTLVPLFCLCFSMVRAWVGVGSLCSFFYNLGFLCLAWDGSQSEAAVNRWPWLRTILR